MKDLVNLDQAIKVLNKKKHEFNRVSSNEASMPIQLKWGRYTLGDALCVGLYVKRPNHDFNMLYSYSTFTAIAVAEKYLREDVVS